MPLVPDGLTIHRDQYGPNQTTVASKPSYLLQTRSTNPIESVFATVRHRTVRTKGALSQDTAKLMVFKLITAASRTWRRLQGENQLPKVIRDVKFRDGIEVSVPTSNNAA